MQKIHQNLTQKYQLYHNWHQHKYCNKIHWEIFVVSALFFFSFIISPLQLNLQRDFLFNPTIQTQKATAASHIIFEDNFDNYSDWSSSPVYGKEEVWPDTIQTILGGPGSTAKSPDWYSYRVAPISNLSGKPLYVVDGTDIHGTAGKSLKYNLENNSYMNGGGMDLYLGGGKTGGYEEIYIRTYIKLEPGFDFQNGGSQFIKLFRLYTGVDPDTDDLGPASTFATNADYNATPQIKRSMNAYLDIVSDGNEDQRLKLAYFLGQQSGIDYIENPKVFPATTFNFKDYLGQWIYVEWYAKLNTVGQADGEMKVWIAPESNKANISQANPTGSWTGLEIRSTADRKFNTIIMADNMSGQWERPVSEQTISWDDLVISAAFVGPDYRKNSPTGIIFEDNFDQYNWSSTSAYGTSVSGKAITPFNLTADFSKPGWATYRQSSTANQVGDSVWAVTQEAGHSGGKSLKYEIENTAPGSWNGGGVNLYLGGPDNSVSGYKELYISAWTKFENNFILPTTGYQMKLLRVYYGVNADLESGDVSSPLDSNNKWKISSYVDYIGNNYMLLREIQFPSNRIPNGQPFPEVGHADSLIFTDYKTWKRVMYHIKLNTYGNSDGLLELYINDSKVASLNNVELVNPAEGNIENNKINVINIPDNYYEMAQGMPSNSEVAFYIDDLVISTAYVPLDYVPGGSPSPDTQAPTVPQDLAATAVSSSQINLSWSASTDTGGSGLAGYKIYRCTGSACTPTTQIATSTTTSYSDTNLTPSITYTYAVSAYDVAGNESGQSTAVNVTTQAQTTGVIFEDSFDNSPDWNSGTMRQPIDQYTAWPDTKEGGSIGNPPNWTSFRSTNDYGEPTYKISAQNARGSTGKALTVNYENNSYIEGGGIDKWIGNPDGNGGGYDDIYIRWFQKFQPGFKWQSEIDNLLKVFRATIGANLNTMNPQDMNSYTNDGGLSTGGYIIPTWHGGQGNFWSTNAGTLGWGTREENTLLSISTPNFFVNPYWHLLTGRKPSGGESAFDDWQWHSMEFHIKLNDIGQQNILFEFWFDGKLIATKRDDLEFRKTPEKKLNFIILADNTFNVGPTLPAEQWLAIDDFVISTSYIGPDYVIGGPDVTPPSISSGSPTGILLAGTTQTTLSVSTDENATCKYGTIPNTPYTSIANIFSTTGTTVHSQIITGLTNGTLYNYYVRCQDTAENANPIDYTISFSMEKLVYKPSDLNQDTKVDQLDFDMLKQDFNRTDKPISDINQDGIVDSRDLGILMSEWTK